MSDQLQFSQHNKRIGGAVHQNEYARGVRESWSLAQQNKNAQVQAVNTSQIYTGQSFAE